MARKLQTATFLQHAPDLKAAVNSCAQVPSRGAAFPSHAKTVPADCIMLTMEHKPSEVHCISFLTEAAVYWNVSRGSKPFAEVGTGALQHGGLDNLLRCLVKTMMQTLPREQVAVKVTRAPVHVGGRYRKLRRDISNSPWIPGKCVTSVQEELERFVLPGFRADLCKFMSAGAC